MGGRSVAGTRNILIALCAGLAAGILLRWLGLIAAPAAVAAPIGQLWLAGLQMTLVPLVVTMVATGIGSLRDTETREHVVGYAIGVFAVLLVLAAAIGAGTIALLLRFWPTPPGALAGLAAPVALDHPPAPSIVEQIVGLIPTNPIAAAVNSAFAPLVVFALLLGIAMGQIAPPRRRALMELLQAIADTMMVIVGWLLWLAPLGIFALTLRMVLTTGLAIAGLLFQSVVLLSATLLVGIAACYLIALVGGRIGPGRFARVAAGPQAVAAGTTSSMATLPAMIEAAETRLDLPPALVGAILPLAVSTFRFGNVVLISGTVLFAAHAGGLTPGFGAIAVACGITILTNLGVIGLPAAAVLYAAEAPAFAAIGAPIELLPLLIATSAIPDILDTTCNVTADLAALTVVGRLAPRRAKAAAR
jgi:Na+/H+-dicarboxylate symporter